MSDAAAPIGTRLGVALAVIGALLLIALLAMIGFGQEIEQRVTRTPGVAAKGATGFQALHDLLAALPGTRVTLARSDADLTGDTLLIVTPDSRTQAKHLAALIEARDFRPTLVILPKWRIERDGLSATRERRIPSILVPGSFEPMLRAIVSADLNRGDARTRRPAGGRYPLAPIEQPQTITGQGIEPWIAVRGQGAILAKVADRRTWILADPDLANNYGLRDPRTARAIVAAIAAMNDGQLDSVAFDLTLHYRAGDRNLVKLMLTPPFIAVTIALIAAAMLAGWSSVVRFGPPRREGRAIPLGKAALIDNIAALTRRAGRVTAGGTRFADARAERLGRRLHAPAGLRGPALTEWLAIRRPGFADAHSAVTDATDEADLLIAAQALDDLTRETA